MSSVEFPEVNHIVQKDVYVDDCLSGAQNFKDVMIRDPPATLSNDEASVNVAM